MVNKFFIWIHFGSQIPIWIPDEDKMRRTNIVNKYESLIWVRLREERVRSRSRVQTPQSQKFQHVRKEQFTSEDPVPYTRRTPSCPGIREPVQYMDVLSLRELTSWQEIIVERAHDWLLRRWWLQRRTLERRLDPLTDRFCRHWDTLGCVRHSKFPSLLPRFPYAHFSKY